VEHLLQEPRVSVIVLNWNGREDTLECLESVLNIDYSAFEVVVVDNGSTDGSVEAIRRRYPTIKVIETGTNLGYAEGNNVGIRAASSSGTSFLFLLNNDTIVDPQILRNLVEVAAKIPDAGVLAARIYYKSDPYRIQYAGAEWLEGESNFIHIGRDETDADIKQEPVNDTAYASGCAMFFRSELVHKVGLLDSRFFLTFEETDWCYRARNAGYRCLVVSDAKVWHKGSASFGGEESPLYLYFYTRNRLLWAERHLGPLSWLKVCRRTLGEVFPISPGFPVLTGQSAKRIYWGILEWTRLLRRLWREPGRKAMRRAVRDYVSRRFFDCDPIIRVLNERRS
jgi:GT2 family glycosyltransferase